MPDEEITSNVKFDGTTWSDLTGVVFELDNMSHETEKGLSNQLGLAMQATTSSCGVIYPGLSVTPNPGGIPNQAKVGTGYAVLSNGAVVYVDGDGLAVSVTDSDEDKYIIVKRSAQYYNSRGLRVGNLPDKNILRIYQPSAEVVATPSSDHAIVWTIDTVSDTGVVAGNTADVLYYSPQVGPAGIDPDRIDNAQPEDDMYDIGQTPGDLQEEFDRTKSVVNRLVHKGNPYAGGFDDSPDDTVPGTPTNLSRVINVSRDTIYQGYMPRTMRPGRAILRLTWAAGVGVPSADYYQIKSTILRYDPAGDVEVSYTDRYYNTPDDTTAYAIEDLTPGIKYRLRVRGIHETNLGDAISDWSVALDTLIRQQISPTLPSGGSLTVTGIYRGFSLNWNSMAEAAAYKICMSTTGIPDLNDEIVEVSTTNYKFTLDPSTDLHYFRVYAIDKLGEVWESIYYDANGYQDQTERTFQTGDSADAAMNSFTGSITGTKIDVDKVKSGLESTGDFIEIQGETRFDTALETYLENEIFTRTRISFMKTDPLQAQDGSGALGSKIQAHEYCFDDIRISNISITAEDLTNGFETSTSAYIMKNDDDDENPLIKIDLNAGEFRQSWTNISGTDYDLSANDWIVLRVIKSDSAGSVNNRVIVTIYVTPLFD